MKGEYFVARPSLAEYCTTGSTIERRFRLVHNLPPAPLAHFSPYKVSVAANRTVLTMLAVSDGSVWLKVVLRIEALCGTFSEGLMEFIYL